MYRIMIVEDDPSLCSNIKEGLSRWKFDPVVIENFDDIVKEFIHSKPHLVIMDINLPYFDGFHWCSKIREVSKVSSESGAVNQQSIRLFRRPVH